MNGEKLLVIAVGNDEEYLREEELSWFRLVFPDADLARYVRNGEIYDCEWNEQGEAITDLE